jgi:hypothetical protein
MPVICSQLAAIPAYFTRDDSSSRELMYPDVHGNTHFLFTNF